MYSPYQLAKKYLRYYTTAANSKGHGIHSPFVFSFIKNVLNDKGPYDCYPAIENRRKELLKNKELIKVTDFGAGSSVIKSNLRRIGDIAQSSLKPRKYAQLLFRMIQYYQPEIILELGTSLGITAAYLSKGNAQSQLYTCEGSDSIALVANETLQSLQVKNAEIIRGDFAATLPELLKRIHKVDFVFLDGNHRMQPTLHYFETILNFAKPETVFVFDDIHWSKEMEDAWKIVQQHQAVTLTIDLFFIGIVLINPDFKVKQHFAIRF